jgi:tmRNA-binding protein
MKDWVKIQTFERIHQAELRKDILEENGIPSVIINEKDSLFLLGEIELYVNKFDEAKAKELIDEFNGLTKINSFVGEKQMRTYRDILSQAGIHAVLKRKEDLKFILDNFELYINNEDLEKAVPLLKEENIDGWKKVVTCDSVSQTKYRTDILDEKELDNFIIKRKDSDYHLEKVEIYVKDADAEKASVLLDSLNGWISVSKYDEIHFAERDEDVLNEHNIKAIIKQAVDGKYLLYVEANNEERAIDEINTSKEWVILKTYVNVENAQTAKRILEKNDISAVIVNERDSSFLIGELELYVEIDNKTKAENILKDF